MTVAIYTRPGEQFTCLDDMEILPVGSVFETTNNNRQYTRQQNGNWLTPSNGEYRTNQFRPTQCRLISVPEGSVTQMRPTETVEGYMLRFRDYALSAARNHSVNYDASLETLNALGTNVELGKGVRITDPNSRNRLPEGSMVFSGNPEIPDSYAVFEKRNSTWHRVLGSNGIPDSVTVYRVGNTVPTPPSWWREDATVEEEQDKIADFKAEVWRLGWRLKRAQGWCSTYESILRDFGITRAALITRTHDGIRVGHKVSPDQAKALPTGTVFRWQSVSNPLEWGLYVRCQVDNAAGTMKIGGTTQSDRNYHSSMEVLSLASDQDKTWPLTGTIARDYYNALNPGVRFAGPGEDERPSYIKCHDQRIVNWYDNTTGPVPQTGRWTYADFGQTPEFTIHHYQGVTL